MPSLSRRFISSRVIALCALSSGLALAVNTTPATARPLARASVTARPVARAASACKAPKYPGVGYFTSLSVTHTSCATGSKVAIAYYHCRVKHGLSGRCVGGVLGFRCSEKRVSIPTEIDARVTCRRHDETVVHTFQQDT
jgi:hypothetical protein